ncbi:RBBP9/YdeN family alpha/beta hydrolase [Nocardia vermiculata]|uniref:Serine hydrolase family protein n=1 Tax=Nocardia vermiculata TaxID=257274 RepID=A0A846XUU9_9NOCA|nr:alpha/beta hydrolase [Nocardia vermiculata]NKY49171.1 serine hydrolase family protein [Nocardia vermiculata]
MPFTADPTVVIVPGLRTHAPDHWQTRLAAELPRVRIVPPPDPDALSLAARVAALDRVLSAVDSPVVLVAHSAGVIITAHWARQPSRTIHSALLATPPDIETLLPPGYPTTAELNGTGWIPIPRRRLPFPSIVAASTTDPLASPSRVTEFAEGWGSLLIELGDVGHLNLASGFGPWARAHELLDATIELGSSSTHT